MESEFELIAYHRRCAVLEAAVRLQLDKDEKSEQWWRGEARQMGMGRQRGELVPVNGNYNRKLPETSAMAATRSCRFARGRCAFHLPHSRKDKTTRHIKIVFPAVYIGYKVNWSYVHIIRIIGVGKEIGLKLREILLIQLVSQVLLILS